MAPTPEADGDTGDLQTLLTMISCCDEVTFNSKLLGEAFGIARPANAVRKVNTALQRHGYRYEKNKVVKVDGDEAGDRAAGSTPAKKTPVKKGKATKSDSDGSDATTAETLARKATDKDTVKAKVKAKATLNKKRKLEAAEEDDGVDGGEVTEGMEGGSVKAEGEKDVRAEGEEEAV